MINFRFHLVSLVAVFLALAVGVVMGYGVLGQPTVETLENRIDTVEANADARRAENDLLQADIERLQRTLNSLEAFAVTDRFTDSTILVVAVRGVAAETMQGIVQLARRAGADAPGILWIEDKWALEAADDRDSLATTLDVDASRRANVRARGWEALVDRLNVGPDPTTDLLSTLTDTGFVSFENVGGDVALGDVGGSGTEVLIVVGSDGAVPAKHVLVPAATAAVDSGLPLAAAEMYTETDGEPVRGALVGLVRSGDSLAAEVPTIDDLDLPSGSAVALLSLADLLRGVVGHYGFGDGASGPTPEWWQP